MVQPSPTVRSRSFGQVAEDYDRYRPPPPREAVEWVLSALSRRSAVAAAAPSAVPLPARVCDLAAGTGALTRLLGALVEGPVLSVEPDPRMVDVLLTRIPNALAVQGQGEELAWVDSSLDALLIASAWHWMDPVPALSEIARVLRSGGAFGILGNGPDRAVGWVAELFGHQSERPDRPNRPSLPELPPAMPFADRAAIVIHYTLPMTRRELVGMAGTYSSVITLPAEERRDRLSVTERLAAEAIGHAVADADETATVELPLRCRCWRTVRT